MKTDIVHITTPLATSIIGKVLTKILNEKGLEGRIAVNSIDITRTDGHLHAHLDADAYMSDVDLIDILKL